VDEAAGERRLARRTLWTQAAGSWFSRDVRQPLAGGVGEQWQAAGVARRVRRAEVPTPIVDRIAAILERLPRCRPEAAWTGVRWRVSGATVAHVFGGEDQLLRLVFRAEPDEVMAFRHLGHPYFKVDWGSDVVGLVLDDDTDWDEVAELLTDSYCLRAPARLADQVERP